jgi:hypothetical protein
MRGLLHYRRDGATRGPLARLCLRLGFAAIAERLNAEGHARRSGKPWAPEMVQQIATRGRTID